jgi:CRP/FNR family transcriptional regulator, cyclic AMP receptor protein
VDINRVKTVVDSVPAVTGSPDVPAPLSDIAAHPFLHGLTPRHLEVLAEYAMKSHFKSGDLIFEEGDPANRFYLLTRGKVLLESSSDGEAVPIQTIGPDEVLGWSWLFPPYYWHFDARAVEPTDAIFFYGTRLRELCEEDHDLGYELLNRTANLLIDRLMATRRELLKCKQPGARTYSGPH